MQALIDFFTVTPPEALLFILVFGIFSITAAWLGEVVAVIQRIGYLFRPETRKLFTWKTAAWMPVRLFILAVLPQAIFQFFTEVLKFS